MNCVQIVFSGLSMGLLSFVHVCNFYRYACMYALAAFMLACVDVIFV